jgi:hypothetical protein
MDPPEKIVVAPVALVALGLKPSLGPICNGIKVEVRLFAEEEMVPGAAKPRSASQEYS